MSSINEIKKQIAFDEFEKMSFDEAEKYIENTAPEYYQDYLSDSPGLKNAFPLSSIIKLINTIETIKLNDTNETKKTEKIKIEPHKIYTTHNGYLVTSKDVKKRGYTNKKVQDALFVSGTNPKEKVVLRLSLNSGIISTSFKGEIEALQKFKNTSGHVPCHLIHEYEKYDKFEKKVVTKAQVFVDKLNGSLEHFIDGLQEISINELLHVFIEITETIEEMHTKYLMKHGDIKPANLLYAMKDKEFFGAVCDYGFTTSIDKKNEVEKKGFYGATAYTAPELFGNTENSIDMSKAEVFALGLTFYQIIEKVLPDWTRTPGRWLLSDSKIEEKIRKKYYDDIQDFILEETKSNETLDIESKKVQLKSLILDMMNPNPEKRPKLSRVTELLSQIELYCS